MKMPLRIRAAQLMPDRRQPDHVDCWWWQYEPDTDNDIGTVYVRGDAADKMLAALKNVWAACASHDPQVEAFAPNAVVMVAVREAIERAERDA